MVICDVERMDQIEGCETVLEVGGERVGKRRYGLLFSDEQAWRGWDFDRGD